MLPELVFINGWGFDARLWDGIAERLKQFKQSRVDLGFFTTCHSGAAAQRQNPESRLISDKTKNGIPDKLSFASLQKIFRNDEKYILVGHSLGFVHGIKQKQDWSGWIAINSFPRFVETESKPGCSGPAVLRDLRQRLQTNPAQALKDFYEFIGAVPPLGEPDAEKLREGLDELRDADVEAVLTALDVPGLVLAGDKDVLVPPATSEALGRMARRGRLKIHNESGHVLPQTAPDWCAAAIADFAAACFGPS